MKKYIFLFILLLAVFLISAVESENTVIYLTDFHDSPTLVLWDNNSELIYYDTYDKSDFFQIFALNINTREISKVTDENASYVLLDVNPIDGNFLVQKRHLSDANSVSLKMEILSGQGKTVKSIPLETSNRQYAIFSPDGNKIAFYDEKSFVDDSLVIYYIDTGKSTNFEHFSHGGIGGSWNTRNEFVHSSCIWRNDRTLNRNLYLYNFGTGARTRLTDFIDRNPKETVSDFPQWSDPVYPQWSPDGEKIVCMLFDSMTNDSRIAIFDKKGDILHIFQDSDPLIGYDWPKWSPDGKKIAFEICRFDKSKGYWQFAIAMIELDPSLQSGPRPENIPEIKIVTFNVFLYLSIVIVIIALAGIGYVLIKRKKNPSK